MPDARLEAALDLIVSPKLSTELERVLLRPKFRRYASEAEVAIYIDLFGGQPPTSTIRRRPDPYAALPATTT